MPRDSKHKRDVRRVILSIKPGKDNPIHDTCDLFLLPQEVICLILSFLDPYALGKMSRVAQIFNHILNHPSWWQPFLNECKYVSISPVLNQKVNSFLSFPTLVNKAMSKLEALKSIEERIGVGITQNYHVADYFLQQLAKAQRKLFGFYDQPTERTKQLIDLINSSVMDKLMELFREIQKQLAGNKGLPLIGLPSVYNSIKTIIHTYGSDIALLKDEKCLFILLDFISANPADASLFIFADAFSYKEFVCHSAYAEILQMMINQLKILPDWHTFAKLMGDDHGVLLIKLVKFELQESGDFSSPRKGNR